MSKKSSFYSLLFTIFNDAIGWGIVLTLFAPLIFDQSQAIVPENWSNAARNLLLGCLIGSYAITQFISMPLIGAMSDHFGRKKILKWTIAGAAVSFFLSAIAVWMGNLILLFACRLLAGLFSGNASTAQASIADMSTEKTKAKNLSMTGVVGGISWIVGPPLGGFLSTKQWISWFDFATPFLFLSAMFLVNWIWVHYSYTETFEKKGHHDWKQEIKDLRKLTKIPRMTEWLSVAFLFFLGWFFYILYYPTLFVQQFGFSQSDIGWMSAYLSIFWFIASLAINRWFGEKLSGEKVMIRWLPVLGILIWIGTSIGTVQGWIWTFPLLGIGGSTAWVCAMAIISNLAGKENQGKAFGILQSMMSLALFVAPLLTGTVAAFNIDLPMYAGTIVLIGVGLFAWGLNRVRARRIGA